MKRGVKCAHRRPHICQSKYCYLLLTQNTDVYHLFYLLALFHRISISETNRVIHGIMISSQQWIALSTFLNNCGQN